MFWCSPRTTKGTYNRKRKTCFKSVCNLICLFLSDMKVFWLMKLNEPPRQASASKARPTNMDVCRWTEQ